MKIYNLKKDTPDHRDYIYQSTNPLVYTIIDDTQIAQPKPISWFKRLKINIYYFLGMVKEVRLEDDTHH